MKKKMIRVCLYTEFKNEHKVNKAPTYFFVEHHQLHVIINTNLLDREVVLDVGRVYSQRFSGSIAEKLQESNF